MDAGQKSGRTSAVSRKPGWGGRRLEPDGSRANFADMPWRAYRQCGGDLSGNTCFSRKVWRICDGPACPYSCRTAEKFCRSTQPSIPAENVASEFSTFRMEGMTGARIAFMQSWAQKVGILFGPSPTAGNGPRRTRRLRLTPQHGIRPGRIPIPCRGSCGNFAV